MKASSIIQSCKLAQQDDLVRPFLAKFYLTLQFQQRYGSLSFPYDRENFVQKF